MLKLYHNPRCSKSRQGLDYLRSKTGNFEVIDYLKEGLSREMLEEILLKTHKEPRELLRTQEELYKKELKGKNFTREEWIQILIENPRLLQRPILVARHKAVWAQPPERIDDLL